MHIHRIDRNKNPLKISGKVLGVLGTLENFQGTYAGEFASRGHLCDSSAFSFYLCMQKMIVDTQDG